MDWIKLTQDNNQWRNLDNPIMNFHKRYRILLSEWLLTSQEGFCSMAVVICEQTKLHICSSYEFCTYKEHVTTLRFIRSEILTAVRTMMSFFWVLAPCRLGKIYLRDYTAPKPRTTTSALEISPINVAYVILEHAAIVCPCTRVLRACSILRKRQSSSTCLCKLWLVPDGIVAPCSDTWLLWRVERVAYVPPETHYDC
jgi:hypothetical protein